MFANERKGTDMRIKKITSQHRRDFNAIYECEHCGHEYEGQGYDDANFHQNVIPKKACPECGETAGDDYRALTTKHPEHAVV
jgi:predicted RNA-binding Zn-ribbon protein involved in translation (DUF1610 family)